jgi:hypothetical protein
MGTNTKTTSKSHFLTLYPPSAVLYYKKERALPGNLHCRKLFSLSYNAVPLIKAPLTFSSLHTSKGY